MTVDTALIYLATTTQDFAQAQSILFLIQLFSVDSNVQLHVLDLLDEQDNWAPRN